MLGKKQEIPVTMAAPASPQKQTPLSTTPESEDKLPAVLNLDGELGNSLTVDEALELLGAGRVETCHHLPWGSNYTFVVTLSHETVGQALAIYKPRRGEAPLWDFPLGTLYKREYASYELARALGWGFIPPTAIAAGPYGIGSMQLYVESDSGVNLQHLGPEWRLPLQRMMAFDLIANNADRKSTHCFVGTEGRMWGIDHGLTFNAQPKLRTVIWAFDGEAIPDSILADLSSLRSDELRFDKLTELLGGLLGRQEIDSFLERYESLTNIGRFPQLDPYKNIPRGFW